MRGDMKDMNDENNTKENKSTIVVEANALPGKLDEMFEHIDKLKKEYGANHTRIWKIKC